MTILLDRHHLEAWLVESEFVGQRQINAGAPDGGLVKGLNFNVTAVAAEQEFRNQSLLLVVVVVVE